MSQLSPGERYIITRQLEDPIDTNTYYVRAYIRKADDDSLIASVNLIDKTEQRFRGEWYVPQYNVPTWITILTKVFTDSGYTTESNLYGRVEETFLIEQRWSHVFGGGGGANISYKKIEEILRQIIKSEIKPTKAEKIDWSPVFSEINMVLRAVEDKRMPEFSKIEFPKPEKIDLNPVMAELKSIKSMTGALKNADLNPVVAYLHDIDASTKDKKELKELRRDLELVLKFVNETLKKEIPVEKEVVKPKRKFNLPFEVKERPTKRAFVI